MNADLEQRRAKELSIMWMEGKQKEVIRACTNNSLLLLTVVSLLPEKEGRKLREAWISRNIK